MNLQPVTGDTLDDVVVAAATDPVAVLFDAVWCPPRFRMADTLTAVVAGLGPGLRAVTVDVDTCPGLVARHHVLAVPTILVFHRGTVAQQVVGVVDGSVLESLLSSMLQRRRPTVVPAA